MLRLIRQNRQKPDAAVFRPHLTEPSRTGVWWECREAAEKLDVPLSHRPIASPRGGHVCGEKQQLRPVSNAESRHAFQKALALSLMLVAVFAAQPVLASTAEPRANATTITTTMNTMSVPLCKERQQRLVDLRVRLPRCSCRFSTQSRATSEARDRWYGSPSPHGMGMK